MIKDLDPVIPGVTHNEVVVMINCDSRGFVETSIPISKGSKRFDVISFMIKDLDNMHQ